MPCQSCGVAGTAGKGSVSLCLLHPRERLNPGLLAQSVGMRRAGPGAWSSPGRPVAALLQQLLQLPGGNARNYSSQGRGRSSAPRPLPYTGMARAVLAEVVPVKRLFLKKASGCVFPVQAGDTGGFCSRMRVLLVQDSSVFMRQQR